MRTGKVYINARFVPEDKASISVFDRGLNYGDGIFETMKAFDGKVIFLKDHLARLKSGIRAIGIPLNAIKNIEKDLKDGILEKLLMINGLSKGYAYLKIIVTRGPDRRGHFPLKNPSPTVIAVCKRLDVKAISKYGEQGIKATLIKGLRQAFPGIKTLNFLPNVLGKLYAEKNGAFEGIFVNEDSNLIEGPSTNLFVIKGGVVKPPPAGKNSSDEVLPGIMRKAVIRRAKKNGIFIVEAPIYMQEIQICEEAFLTNSILDIVPIIGLDSKPVGNGKPGDVTHLIQKIMHSR